MSQTAPLPHWQLTSIFPGLESPEFERAKTELKTKTDALSSLMDEHGVNAQENVPVTQETAALFDELTNSFNDMCIPASARCTPT